MTRADVASKTVEICICCDIHIDALCNASSMVFAIPCNVVNSYCLKVVGVANV